MDEKYIEMGEATQAAVLERGIAERSAAAFPDKPVPVAKQTTHCIEEDCGIDLPILRVQRGQERCVECQTTKEKREKRGF